MLCPSSQFLGPFSFPWLPTRTRHTTCTFGWIQMLSVRCFTNMWEVLQQRNFRNSPTWKFGRRGGNKKKKRKQQRLKTKQNKKQNGENSPHAHTQVWYWGGKRKETDDESSPQKSDHHAGRPAGLPACLPSFLPHSLTPPHPTPPLWFSAFMYC